VEGGQLLSGQPAKVVVRMLADLPVSFGWSAEVRNRRGQIVASLQDKDDNVAWGWLSPVSGEEYTAYVKDQRGTEMSVPLPPATDTGTFLQVTAGARSIRYGILLRGVNQSRAPFMIRGIQQGQVVYTAVLAKDRIEAAGSIPLDSLDQGTLYLEVLDANGSRLADRLCYVHVATPPDTHLFDSLHAPVGRRAMQAFRIRVKEGLPWVFAFARAVDDSVFDEQENLFSRLYLSSISAEPLLRPARYFRGDSLPHILDALYISLTDAYRKENQQVQLPWSGKPDSLLSFQGIAYSRNGPLANQEINLIIQTSEHASSYQQVTTDAQGAFRLENLYFLDSAKVFFQTNGVKDRNKNDVSVSLTRTGVPVRQPADLPASEWVLSGTQKATVEMYPSDRLLQAIGTEKVLANKFKTMDEIRVTARRKSQTRQLDEELSSGLFRSGDVDIIDMVNDHPEAAGFTNIFSFLQGKFPSLQFILQNGDYVPVYRGSGITIAIDEVPSQTSLANLILPVNVAMVKLQRYNIFIGGPVLSIYTRRGVVPAGNADYIQGLNLATIHGYGREFPRIQVNHLEQELGSMEQDDRTILYWNYALSENGQFDMEAIRFFRNDTGKPYRLTIVGMQDNGVPALLLDRLF
jgi:hypothetical protein